MNSVILENIPITAEVTALSPQYSAEEREEVIDRIKRLIKEQDAVLVAHYYTDSDLQMIAEETGGFVSDSLDMARFGQDHPASTLIVAGVRFMGETAKILSPEKRVLMPTLEATCSLDIGCPADEFKKFCADHPDRTVVVYANTSAEVKALSDWVVTSAIALKVAKYLKEKGEKILWAPDKHLGHYIQSVTGADMVLWQGSCVVHDEFREEGLKALLEKHPDAGVLVHPESPKKVIELADVVGSTSQLIKATQELPHKKFVVATDRGIFYKMKQAAPEKTLMESPTEGIDATCTSCAHCPWMAMNGLDNLVKVLETGRNEIKVAEELRLKALGATQRMMAFAKNRTIQVLGRSNA